MPRYTGEIDSGLPSAATPSDFNLLAIKEEDSNDVSAPYVDETSGSYLDYQIDPMNPPAQQWQTQWDPLLPTSPAIPRTGGDPDHTFQGEPAHPFPCYPIHHQSSSSSESGRSSTHHPCGPAFTQSQTPGFSGHDPEGRLQALAPAATHAAPSNSMRVGPPTIGVDISLADAESRLRRVHNFRPGVPLSLSSIPDPPPSDMHQDTLVQIAIWSSPQRRLLASEIYAAIEARFRSFPEGTNQPWRRSVRHMLSFKRAFVKSRDKDHSGRHYWELDYEHLDHGYKRERKRGGSDTSKKRGKDAQKTKEDSPDLFLQDHLEDDSYLKEECVSPPPTWGYPGPQAETPSSSTSTSSAERTTRSRYSRSQSLTSQQGLPSRHSPLARHQSAPTSNSVPLPMGGPIYLYPPGHPSPTHSSSLPNGIGGFGNTHSFYPS
ncbi:hypothetical protein PQX77_004927 [Marasmius sp. AFHP31]|nr:hypothetical protein PQX77_004927 [Marasmius sp. AFHP31]